jgi:hypothetical protein
MMESTIGGVLFDVWFKEGGQQKTMARNLNFLFIKASNSHRQGWNPEVVSVQHI